MVTWTPKFLLGLALFVFGATILLLFGVEAWANGATRLPEQATPARLSLLALGLIPLLPGAWAMRAAFRDWEKRGRKRWGRYDA
jgi:hypothetical protein